MSNSCVYFIENIETRRRYIGSTASVRQRWNAHRNSLKRNCHDNRFLQRAWNKYGPDSFRFAVLFYCDAEHLIWFEQRAFDWFAANNPQLRLYNLSPTAGSVRGMRRSSATRALLSERARGRRHTAEARAKMRDAAKGNQRNLGRKHSEKSRLNMGRAQKHKIVSDETRAKISLSQQGRQLTPDHRAKLSAAAKRRVFSSEERAAMSRRMTGNRLGLGYQHTAEARAKISNRVISETTRAKLRLSNARRKLEREQNAIL